MSIIALRNEDCKQIELWRISFNMGAEGESTSSANLSGKRTKIFYPEKDMFGIPMYMGMPF